MMTSVVTSPQLVDQVCEQTNLQQATTHPARGRRLWSTSESLTAEARLVIVHSPD